MSEPDLSDESKAVFDMADDYRAKFNIETVDNYCLLAALVTL